MNDTLTYAELMQLLQSAGTYGQNSPVGPSFSDQWRNGNAQLRVLNDAWENKDITDKSLYDSAKKGIQAGKASAAIGGGLAAIGGLTDLMNNAVNLSQIGDITEQENLINDVGNIGSTTYGTFDQLASDYERLGGSNLNFNYKDIRGGSTGERIGGVASSMLSGASTGLAIGGPWGALAGAVVGLGTGVGGWLAGDVKARNEQRRLNASASMATSNAQENLAAGNENLTNYNFRSAVTNHAAGGGQIERKELTVKEFADRVLKKQKSSYRTHSAVVRQHCAGGTMIRIKR